jgi:hypothetical protein
VVKAKLKVLSWDLLWETEKTWKISVSVVVIWAKNQTKHLSNTNQEVLLFELTCLVNLRKCTSVTVIWRNSADGYCILLKNRLAGQRSSLTQTESTMMISASLLCELLHSSLMISQLWAFFFCLYVELWLDTALNSIFFHWEMHEMEQMTDVNLSKKWHENEATASRDKSCVDQENVQDVKSKTEFIKVTVDSPKKLVSLKQHS